MPSHSPVARLLPASVVVAISVAGCGGGSSTTKSTSASRPAAVTYAAPGELQPLRPAADFSLRDSTGNVVRLSQFKGKAVLLTFLYTHCPDICPLIVGQLHTALAKLRAEASQVQILAVSVDPKGDSPKAVNKFLAAREMTGRMKFLVGSKRELASVWKAYGIQIEASPERREVGHTGIVYGITAKGIATTVYPSNLKPEWIAHDVPLLASS
jgi:protein SCO1